MNILFCCTKKLNSEIGKGYCTYYSDIALMLKKKYNLQHYSGKISKLSQLPINKNTDLIIIGFGYNDTGGRYPNELYHLNINDIKIPVIIILNKEYDAIDKKLEWIKRMKPKAILTIHHDYEKYKNITGIPCHRIMWSVNNSIFKDYKEMYKYDIFYSGVIRKEQTNNYRKKIIEELKKLKGYQVLINARYEDNNYKGKIINSEDYAKNISKSKICFVTTSAGNLVNPRFFEVMASRRSLIICNRMDKIVYEDMLIDGFNCVMFDTVAEFIEKFKYYINHEDERMKIVNQSFEYFCKTQTWDNRLSNITSIIEKYI